MAGSQDSYNKKEKEKKRLKKRKDKELQREERKSNSKKGKSFDDMIAYVDEFGNFSSSPPDPSKKEKVKAEDVQISVAKKEDQAKVETVRRGIVSFFNESKGFGFIKDSQTGESFFVHINNLDVEIKENYKVSFELEKGHKGPTAVRVKII